MRMKFFMSVPFLFLFLMVFFVSVDFVSAEHLSAGNPPAMHSGACADNCINTFAGSVKGTNSFGGEVNSGNCCIINLYSTGRGAPPADKELTDVQKYLLAERAGIADGYRLISEKLRGIFLDAYTRAGNYIVDYDRINIATNSFIRGVEILDIKHKDNGVCQVEMKIAIRNHQLCNHFPKPIVNQIKCNTDNCKDEGNRDKSS